MITSSGRVKVLDFGLAKFHSNVTVGEAATRSGITAEGMAIGTAPYMSPEQASGDSIDHRSDVFSLGAVFHEMLTGHQPFKGRSVAQVLAAILRDDPPALTDSRPDAPPALGDIVRRCLRKPPEERYASAVELHEALTSVARRGSTSMSWPATSSRTDAAIGQGEQFEVVGRLFSTKWGLTLVLVLLGVINWIETNAEELWSVRRGSWLGYDVAAAFRWFEGAISFDRHDLAGPAAVYLGSIAYFFVPLVLVTATLVALVPRRDITGYRQFVIAITICYLVSLPFYLLLPIPERWAFPDSQAILLSDLWSARLIETIRPISGLDNCFPSFHVSGTVALVLTWYAQRLRYRHAVAFLGAAVVISTLLLGIHWLADIVAGLGLGLIAVRVARRF
jgi:membrane-associated phospholipid phosphatase